MTNYEFAWIVAIIVFGIKHFIADFLLQTPYMLGKFYAPPHCYKPLSAHCSVHVVFALMLFSVPMSLHPSAMSDYWGLVISLLAYEFVAHFLVDITKSQLTRIKNLRPADKMFWVLIGIDQFLHLVLSIPLIYIMAEMIEKCL
jgi:hypothetical protein